MSQECHSGTGATLSVDSETTGVASPRELMFYSRVALPHFLILSAEPELASGARARRVLFHTPKSRGNVQQGMTRGRRD